MPRNEIKPGPYHCLWDMLGHLSKQPCHLSKTFWSLHFNFVLVFSVVINRQQLYALLWSVYPKTARDPGTYFGRRFFEAGKTDLLSLFGDRQHVHASKDEKVKVFLRIKPTKDAAQMLAKFLTNFLWEKF